MIVLAFLAGGALEMVGFLLVGWDIIDLVISRRGAGIPPSKLQGNAFNQWTVEAYIDERVGGNITRKAIGLALFVIGLIVQTAANIWAL